MKNNTSKGSAKGDTEALYELFLRYPRVCTDTRKITSGSLFFALHGESFDGNDFALKALQSGASHVVVDRDDVLDQNPELSGSITLVDDTLTALQDLACHHRRALGVKILAISGSNGKTTTKELLREVLSKGCRIYATEGNLNNHIGVPLTLLSITSDVDLAVVEMGASHPLEIAALCDIAEPDCGMLTNVGRAHLEGFGGEAGVRRAKGELFDYLQRDGGVVFVSSEDEVVSSMAREREGLRVEWYSYSLAEGVESNLEGEYNRYNIASAVAVGLYFGVSMQDIRCAISNYHPTNNRSQRLESGRNTLIVDCYNANPSSMESAISNFAREEYPNRRKMLILGDMFELGEWSALEHQRILEMGRESGSERIIVVGAEFGKVVEDRDRVEHYASREELESRLREESLEGYVILIKGSRGVGLERIISLL